ncbi:hypothetical protein GE061_002734 [Apolygus lucorum]|uniref:Guanylate cyclase n=1 Tax=Apolygus lucorum TaxID=248454 RepID=A0A8S9X5Z8_APOLU|nr:hypothetical protein GE061_002734 [Apolygus lucorum]
MVSAAVVLLSLLVTSITCEELLLGYVTGSQRRAGDMEYARPGLTISGAISLAVDEVNRGILKGTQFNLSFVVAETMGDELESIHQTATLWKRNISAYIGPQETCLHEAKMAAAFNLPMISYFCTNYETSDKVNFPTFARTRPPDNQISKSVAAVLLAFNWTQVTFFYQNSSDLTTVADSIKSILHGAGVTILATRTWVNPYHHGYMDNPFVPMVKQTYRHTRIYVILGPYYEHLGLLLALDEMKLFDKGEYWVVGVDITQYDESDPSMYLRGLLQDEIEPKCVRAFRSYLGVAPSPPTNLSYFASQVNHYLEKAPFNYPNPVGFLGGEKQISAEAAYLYDAVVLYATAVLETHQAGGDIRNGTAIVEKMKCRHYHSAMGYMGYMDSNGDAEGNYTLLARLEPAPGNYGLYPVGRFSYRRLSDNLPELNLMTEINWINGEPPIAFPPCGFLGEKCVTHTMEIMGGIAGTCAALFVIVSLVIFRNWRYEQELDSLLWKLDFKDIQVNDDLTMEAKSNRSSIPLIRTSQVSLTSNPDVDFRYSTIYTPIGIFKGRAVAIKKVNKKSIDINRNMKKEMKLIKDLRHDNLNAFVGATVDPPNICIVTDYCTRGSLKDILENEDVKLDNMFIASLIGDILRGLIYLHDSSLRFHGNLKSSNCLVDSRWVVKLADFGLKEFKSGADDFHQTWSLKHLCDEQHACKCEGLLYRAPELLRVTTETPGPGSQKGDVYSFGIILYELHSRKGPFGSSSGLTPRQIVHRIIFPQPNTSPLRPPLDQLERSFDYVRDCLIDCWHENPEVRPDIKTVRTRLRPMRKGMKPNIFDNMIAMMEAYANNLEALVDERTDQLVEEKKKTEALLFEMLPRCVAEQLRRGHKVEAEHFDCVTIYFSDIVGFTAMSAESTPLQVVDFLNDLYTCFDSIIVNYDVYKVETIGDAYMVVSGLPVRNGIQHAAEIASLSLDLLLAVKKFKIRHRPQDRLQLRIGIHSGPVCAGVVGKKMPRYCLFGDTVNTASRMESTGLAQKIHCSEACKDLLDKLCGYIIEDRGFIDLKGKGEAKTYWLVGEEEHIRTQRRITREERVRESRKNPRSSLKVPKGLSRAASFESPKKLRFANHTMEFNPYQKTKIESIVENSPSKCLEVEFCDHLSVSCPCIENVQAPGGDDRDKMNETTSDSAIFTSDQINAPLLAKGESHV